MQDAVQCSQVSCTHQLAVSNFKVSIKLHGIRSLETTLLVTNQFLYLSVKCWFSHYERSKQNEGNQENSDVTKVKFTLGQATKAKRACRSVAIWRWAISAKLRLLYPQERDLIPIVQEAEWASGPIRIGTAYLVSTRIQSPDSPTCSKSLF